MPSRRWHRSMVWLRRDLRDEDHAALSLALQHSWAVRVVFVFDAEILSSLPANDRRVSFIWQCVAELKLALQQRGGDLHIVHGVAHQLVPQLAQDWDIDAVICAEDYEPAAMARDERVAQSLRAQGRGLHRVKDQLIFARDEILTQAGQPYRVFTPYSRAWRAALLPLHLSPHPTAPYWQALEPVPAQPMPSLESLGFELQPLPGWRPGAAGAQLTLQDFVPRLAGYAEKRDFPAQKGPSYLSVHLRFGTVSIRQLVSLAVQHGSRGAEVWLNELIWREFYAMILWFSPEVVQNSWRPEYRALSYPNPPGHFQAWCEARTGYPLVDAAMRQLLGTGYMHNRLRMVSASFLVKDLLVDWRWGEAWFARHLMDFDLASNNGGWQWAASTGCDAQPYFRIFNPVSQSEKFDPHGQFIRRYLPELAKVPDAYIHAPWQMPLMLQQQLGVLIGRDYPAPIVDHARARLQALDLYKTIRPDTTSA